MNKVTLYVKDGCPYCDAAKKHYTEQGVDFEEINIFEVPGAKEKVLELTDGESIVPVIVDGGFRRGTDILKALALGADAVAIGRPYVWGLGAFGQAGVEAVLDILRRELQIVMMQVGATRLSGISSAAIRT